MKSYRRGICNMSRKQKNFRLPALALDELNRMCAAFDMTESEVIILAIDTLFHRQSPQSLSKTGIQTKRDLLVMIVSGEATLDKTRTPLAE